MEHLASYLPSFQDELSKIATAGDLMNPAVVSDSAVVDGPPATPFTRRRGFKRTEQVFPKEGGVDIRNLLRKPKLRYDEMGRKLYTKAPRHLKDIYQQALQNPADWSTTPTTIARVARGFGVL